MCIDSRIPWTMSHPPSMPVVLAAYAYTQLEVLANAVNYLVAKARQPVSIRAPGQTVLFRIWFGGRVPRRMRRGHIARLACFSLPIARIAA